MQGPRHGAAHPLEEFDILVDTREAVSSLSATDLWYLADRLVRYPRTFAGRTAILCPSERFDHARSSPYAPGTRA